MAERSSPIRRRPVLAAAGSVVLAASTLAAVPAATASGGSAGSGAARAVVARGLNSPRLLSFRPNGTLFIAEAGKGGKGPCVVGPTGKVCFGSTGSVTRIRHGKQMRVLKGLPSLAGAGGAEPIGPADVRVTGHGRYVLSIGIGQDTKNRRALGRQARLLGTLATGRLGRHHRPHVLADLAAFEARTNPDKSVAHDSDPTGFIMTRHGFIGTDSGGNTLVRSRIRHAHRARISDVAVFGTRNVKAPDGSTVPMQAVPTSVSRGPDGALYVSQLTGFPFPKGAAHIFRVVPGHRPTVYASGLTNVTNLAWWHRKLYAVEIAANGLLDKHTGFPSPTGALVRVHRGDNSMLDTVAGHLRSPYGLAVRRGSAYVSTCTLCGPGAGTVTRIRLR